jgi:hypothetical protein
MEGVRKYKMLERNWSCWGHLSLFSRFIASSNTMQQQIWDAYAITTSTCENRTWKNMIFGQAQTTTIKVKKIN